MDKAQSIRAEEFLKLYRRLEGLLEMRYAGHRMSHSSVVREYMDDPDSVPYRTQIDLCREIRNLLSHNADDMGEPVVEPSGYMIDIMEKVIEHVQRPRLAVDFGTGGEKIFFAHPNERVVDVIRRMRKMGFSHVPVKREGKLVGVFSASSLFFYMERNGLSDVNEDMRIAELKDAIGLDSDRSEKYMFLPEDATIQTVRDAFQRRPERNSRVAAVFITANGERAGELLAMLTPWDVLRDNAGEY